MTFFIGGKFGGDAVGIEDLHKSEVGKSYGSGFSKRPVECYVRTKVNLNGDIKTFYILDGKHPSIFRSEIIELWDRVETEVYAI